MSGPDPATDVVLARPRRSARWATVAAAVVLAVFLVTAVVMRRFNAGADFTWKDQLGTATLGVILSGLCLMPTRPRLRADVEAVRIRAFLGDYRTVPWDVVVDVRFPKNVRFAQLVLDGEETLAIYAVQRLDADQSVDVMRRLRGLAEVARSGSS